MNEIITRAMNENRPDLLERVPERILTPEETELFSYVLDYAERHGRTPSVTKVATRYEWFIPWIDSPTRLVPEPEPITAVLEEEIERRKTEIAKRKIEEARNTLRKDDLGLGTAMRILGELEEIEGLGDEDWFEGQFEVSGYEGTWEAPPEAPYLVQNTLPVGTLNLWYGEAKSLKTSTAYHLAHAIAFGHEKWLGNRLDNHGPVLIVDEEMGKDAVNRKFREIAVGFGEEEGASPVHPIYKICRKGWDLVRGQNVQGLASYVKRKGVKLVIIDSVTAVLDGTDQARMDLYRKHFNGIQALCEETGATFIFIHHSSAGGHAYGGTVQYAIYNTILEFKHPEGSLTLTVRLDRSREGYAWKERGYVTSVRGYGRFTIEVSSESLAKAAEKSKTGSTETKAEQKVREATEMLRLLPELEPVVKRQWANAAAESEFVPGVKSYKTGERRIDELIASDFADFVQVNADGEFSHRRGNRAAASFWDSLELPTDESGDEEE